MDAVGLARYAAVAVAMACAACSAASTVAPSEPPAAGDVAPSNVAAASKYFDYVINVYGSYASIFDYPTGDKQTGTVKNVGGQGCTNVRHGYGKKIVWIVAGPNQISEYAVPSKLLRTLSVTGGNSPSSCAMNSRGDLAVGLLIGPLAGEIVVFDKARGTGRYIETPLKEEIFDGYDDEGNLYFDGVASRAPFQLDEIPKGSTVARTIQLPNTISFPGSVQWDGTYLTVEDQRASKIYRYAMRGTNATLEGTVTLQGAANCTQTWIAVGDVLCADSGNDDGEIFAYPAGGPAIATLRGNFDQPLGTVAAER